MFLKYFRQNILNVTAGRPSQAGDNGLSRTTGLKGLQERPGQPGNTDSLASVGLPGVPGLKLGTGFTGATGRLGGSGSTGAPGRHWNPGLPGATGRSGAVAVGATGRASRGHGFNGLRWPLGTTGRPGVPGPSGMPGLAGGTRVHGTQQDTCQPGAINLRTCWWSGNSISRCKSLKYDICGIRNPNCGIGFWRLMEVFLWTAAAHFSEMGLGPRPQKSGKIFHSHLCD